MPWKCPNCGYEPIPDDTTSCPQCGYTRQEQPEQEKQAESIAVVGEKVEKVVEEVEKREAEKQVEVVEETKPAEKPPKAKLLIVQTPVAELKGKGYDLLFELFPTITVGRSPENVVCIPDPYISRFHAKIVYEDGKFYIEDVGSTNGTYIYRQDKSVFEKIEPNTRTEIENGALIRLGLTTIVKFVVEA
ncbi:MAG TPA: FHA domain-containing protein [Pyrodictiaceae archaeon]|nr:FHA domain-containing protein [Pyrodictiaceae archaeon]HIQ55968.1 FHA domain-containing protein [Pyrodictium sp.]